MSTVTLTQAEIVQTIRTVTVPAGTRVILPSGVVATITQAGLDCDCGKGVLCPLNPQERA